MYYHYYHICYDYYHHHYALLLLSNYRYRLCLLNVRIILGSGVGGGGRSVIFFHYILTFLYYVSYSLRVVGSIVSIIMYDSFIMLSHVQFIVYH